MNFTSCDFYGKDSKKLTTSSSTASGNFSTIAIDCGWLLRVRSQSDIAIQKIYSFYQKDEV
ncbi:hypothetical protein QUB70_20885 [Microcoleus sp. A003_D6]|uniref:hypothetical protein n=1 Tax=Microcoleus sp. A003_D6 TaxID=3055266 RepID=UPI002FCE8330